MANDEWRTPEWVWKPYAPFDLDVAANALNALAPKFITKEMNAFEVDWSTIITPPCQVWCNPPYSPGAGPLLHWVEMFQSYAECGYRIISLLPADTSTKWFHRLLKDDEVFSGITFLERRVRHLDPTTGKPGGSPKFGSIIVEFFPQ